MRDIYLAVKLQARNGSLSSGHCLTPGLLRNWTLRFLDLSSGGFIFSCLKAINGKDCRGFWTGRTGLCRRYKWRPSCQSGISNYIRLSASSEKSNGGGGCFRRVQTNPEDCPRSGVEHPAGSPRRCSGLLVISEAMGDFLCPVKLPAMCDRQTGPEGAEADAPKTREKKILKII